MLLLNDSHENFGAPLSLPTALRKKINSEVRVAERTSELIFLRVGCIM